MKTLVSDVSASLFYRVVLKQRLQAQIDSDARSVYDIVLCVYERFHVEERELMPNQVLVEFL